MLLCCIVLCLLCVAVLFHVPCNAVFFHVLCAAVLCALPPLCFVEELNGYVSQPQTELRKTVSLFVCKGHVALWSTPQRGRAYGPGS